MSANVYVAPEVAAVQEFFADLYPLGAGVSVLAELSVLADRLLRGLRSRIEAAYTLVRNWHPESAGVAMDELVRKNWKLADAELTIAREHGFADWAAVKESHNQSHDPDFEACCTAVINGDLTTLRHLISRRPSLVGQRSTYGHRATLLHYTASNGLETRRQQVPSNLSAIVDYLITSGADKSATITVYGGDFDTLALFTSSAHPYAAGVGKAIEPLLQA